MFRISKKIAVVSIAVVLLACSAAIFLKTAYVPVVIMYHSIDGNSAGSKLSVSPASFDRQMEFLRKNSYNIVSLEKMAEYIRGKRVPFKTIAVTFDDGYYNNYEYAYPVLKKYSIPATIFVIIKHVGDPGWLGWNEIKEMSDSGPVSIGSHTVMHNWLPTTGSIQLKKELKDSKAIIEENIGKPVNTFCYPLGAYNDRVKDAVKAAGYACAVVTNPGRSASNYDPYAIKRIKISKTSDNLIAFWFETSGYYTWVKEMRKGS